MSVMYVVSNVRATLHSGSTMLATLISGHILVTFVHGRSVRSAASSAICRRIPMNGAISVWSASRNSRKPPTWSRIWKSIRVPCLCYHMIDSHCHYLFIDHWCCSVHYMQDGAQNVCSITLYSYYYYCLLVFYVVNGQLLRPASMGHFIFPKHQSFTPNLKSNCWTLV